MEIAVQCKSSLNDDGIQKIKYKNLGLDSLHRFRSQYFIRESLKFSFFLTAVLLYTLAQAHAQNHSSMVQKGSSAQQQVPYEIQLSSEVAETRLIHKEEPTCKKNSDGIRITGTVVIAISIDKNGKVIYPHALSGPKILRPLALAAVRKYQYRPYLLNNIPVEVETVVSINIDCVFHTGQA